MPSSPAHKPTVHLYSICWNEEYMLKFFFRHYDPFVDRYVFFDDGSTDATLGILGAHPRVEVRQLQRLTVDSYVLAARAMHETAWKESRGAADWVIITAVDEFLYVREMSDYLARCTQAGVTAIPALGYQMLSSALPPEDQPLTASIRRGCPYDIMNKLSIFDPDKIKATNQEVGRHRAAPEGEVRFPAEDRVLLLHYKYLSLEWIEKRYLELRMKLGAYDRENRWGFQYDFKRDELQADWDRFYGHSVADVLAPDYNPHEQHSELAARWWRAGNAQAAGAKRNPDDES